jgi:hypothetical protein
MFCTFKFLYPSLSGHLLIAKNGLFVVRYNLKTAARTSSNYVDFFDNKEIREKFEQTVRQANIYCI